MDGVSLGLCLKCSLILLSRGNRFYKGVPMPDDTGLPIIDRHLQILTTEQWTAMQAELKTRAVGFRGEPHERLLSNRRNRCSHAAAGSCSYKEIPPLSGTSGLLYPSRSGTSGFLYPPPFGTLCGKLRACEMTSSDES